MILQFAIGAMVMGAFFVLAWLALFIYVWTSTYPWLKMVGKFAAKPLNLASLVLLYVLLLAALVGVVILFMGSSGWTAFLLFLLLLLLLVPLFIVYVLLLLAIVVWIVRLIKGLYARWRGWIEGFYLSTRLQLIKRKIRSDMRQEGGFRGRPGAGIGRRSGTGTGGRPGGGIGGKSGTGTGGRPGGGVSGKPTAGFKMGKKGKGFKEKLGALKSELSSEVQRARSKLFRRK